MGALWKRLRAILAGSSPGFTLPEVLFGVMIITMTMGLMGSAVFQALGITRWWTDDVIATKELRNVGPWLAGDGFQAQSTDLADGAASVSSVTLTWTDTAGTNHSATYSVVGSELMRDYDGSQHTVARGVVSTAFSRSGDILTLTLVVEGKQGGIESKSLNVKLRRLQ